ncbi:hypothetical protein C8J57DRAFT_1719761 [Mycena rebaudengoi]|nr:hypothetical protein C8J57DRAFT_1719761 [Mycena rebaudengoi]
MPNFEIPLKALAPSTRCRVNRQRRRYQNSSDDDAEFVSTLARRSTPARERVSVSEKRASTVEASPHLPTVDDLEDNCTQYVLIDNDIFPDVVTQLRAYAARWRGVSALQPAPPPHAQGHTPFVFGAPPSACIPARRRLRMPSCHRLTPSTPPRQHLRACRGAEAVGPPLDIALDARAAGGRGEMGAERMPAECGGARVWRTTCEVGRGRWMGKASHARILRIFATRALRQGEEIVVGWEWDDASAVHWPSNPSDVDTAPLDAECACARTTKAAPTPSAPAAAAPAARAPSLQVPPAREKGSGSEKEHDDGTEDEGRGEEGGRACVIRAMERVVSPPVALPEHALGGRDAKEMGVDVVGENILCVHDVVFVSGDAAPTASTSAMHSSTSTSTGPPLRAQQRGEIVTRHVVHAPPRTDKGEWKARAVDEAMDVDIDGRYARRSASFPPAPGASAATFLLAARAAAVDALRGPIAERQLRASQPDVPASRRWGPASLSGFSAAAADVGVLAHGDPPDLQARSREEEERMPAREAMSAAADFGPFSSDARTPPPVALDPSPPVRFIEPVEVVPLEYADRRITITTLFSSISALRSRTAREPESAAYPCGGGHVACACRARSSTEQAQLERAKEEEVVQERARERQKEEEREREQRDKDAQRTRLCPPSPRTALVASSMESIAPPSATSHRPWSLHATSLSPRRLPRMRTLHCEKVRMQST